jgi:hypothetical protein
MSTDSWKLLMAFDEVLTESSRLCRVLDAMATAGFPMQRIDDSEPVRRPCSAEVVRSLLTEPPVTLEMPCRGLIARGSKTMAYLRACRPTEPGGGSVNIVSLTTRQSGASQVNALAGLAEALLAERFLGHACVDLETELRRQHVKGTINDRLPGVFWANVFSDRYLDAMGVSTFERAPWSSLRTVPNGAIAYLYDDPLDPPADLRDRIEAARSALGAEKFAHGAWPELPVLGRGTVPAASEGTSADDTSRPADVHPPDTAPAAVAARMGSDAEICMRRALENGFQLDGTEVTLPTLEELVDSLTPWSAAGPDVRNGMVQVIGAYFGQVLVDAGHGRWVQGEQFTTPAVEFAGGMRVFPHARVAKRWEEGSGRSLVTLFDFATSRQDHR